MKREDAINSPAYKMLQSMIDDRVGELKSWMQGLDLRIEQAKKPSYYSRNHKTGENEEHFYKPMLDVGVSFDEVQEIEIPYEIRGLKIIADSIAYIVKLETEIGDLNREKLYLIQADGDWQDDGRRSKKVFGVKKYE
jgi:hypothetical protein